jgi:hypothetical protein
MTLTEKINPYGGNLSHRLSLVNSDGGVVDITRIVSEFTIYESIFDTTMSADFVVVDSLGLIDGVSPFTGQEIVVVEFISNNATLLGADPAIAFKVYKVDNKTELTPGSVVYTVHAASLELELNLTSYVDTPYRDLKAHEVVQSILDKHIFFNERSKALFVEQADNVITYTPARHHPFDAIRLIANESKSAIHGDASHYLFYQTRQGFNFRTLSNLLTQEPLKDNLSPSGKLSYFFSDPATVDGKKLLERSIIAFTFLHNVDTLDSLTGGLYENDMIVIDPITKTFQETRFNYLNNFNNLPHITGGGNPLINSSGATARGSAHNRLLFGDLNNAAIEDRTIGGRINARNDPHIFHGNERYSTVKNNVAQVASLKQHGMHITVPANLNINAGDVINIFVPTYRIRENELSFSFIRHYGSDPAFLVTSVSTRFTKDGDYVTNMECVKESFGVNLSGRSIAGGSVIGTRRIDLERFVTQKYTDLPFSSDKFIGAVAGTFSSIVASGAKDNIIGLSQSIAEDATTADAIASAATNTEAAVAASIDQVSATFSGQAIAGNIAQQGVQLATGKLLSAFGGNSFAKLIKIIKLLEKIPIFKTPSTSIKSNISKVRGGS